MEALKFGTERIKWVMDWILFMEQEVCAAASCERSCYGIEQPMGWQFLCTSCKALATCRFDFLQLCVCGFHWTV